MKKSLLLTLALFTVLCVRVSAETTSAQEVEPEYMLNNGYSESLADEVLKIKNRVTGQPCEPLIEHKYNKNKFCKFFRKCYEYIDPAQDSDERYHHDIQMSPAYTDL